MFHHASPYLAGGWASIVSRNYFLTQRAARSMP